MDINVNLNIKGYKEYIKWYKDHLRIASFKIFIFMYCFFRKLLEYMFHKYDKSES